MQGALKDLPPRRKRQGSGEQDRDRRETQQGSIAGAVPASARSLQQLWSIKQTSGSTIKPRGWASVPPSQHTQAFVALCRATGAGSEAPVCQDEPLRVTGAGPQEQTPPRLGYGCTELVKGIRGVRVGLWQ